MQPEKIIKEIFSIQDIKPKSSAQAIDTFITFSKDFLQKRKISFSCLKLIKSSVTSGIKYGHLETCFDLSVQLNDPVKKLEVKNKYGMHNIISCGVCCSLIVEPILVNHLKNDIPNVKLKHNSIIGECNGTYFTVCDFFIAKKHIESGLKLEFGLPTSSKNGVQRVFLAEHKYHEQCAKNRHLSELKQKERNDNKKRSRFNKDSLTFISGGSNECVDKLYKRAKNLINIDEEFIRIEEPDSYETLNSPKVSQIDLSFTSDSEIDQFDPTHSSPNLINLYNNNIDPNKQDIDDLCSKKTVKLVPKVGSQIILDLTVEIKIKNALELLGIDLKVIEGTLFSKYLIIFPSGKWNSSTILCANKIIESHFEPIEF